MMASPLAFVPARRSPCSPPLSSAFSSSRRRIQEHRTLRLPIAKNPGFLGFGNRFSRRGGRRRGGRGGAGWNAGRWEDAFELGGSVDLEAEVYEFMQRSANPNDFPTKDELIAAGRVDLVQAIATQGGWLAFGWDSGEEGREEGSVNLAAGRQDSEKEIPQEDDRMSQHRFSSDSWGSGGSWKEDPMAVADSEACSAASSSGRSM